jgi:hypothetical protein
MHCYVPMKFFKATELNKLKKYPALSLLILSAKCPLSLSSDGRDPNELPFFGERGREHHSLV